MAITCGAVLLAISFWMEERALEAAAKAGVTEGSTVVADEAAPVTLADDATSLGPVTDPPS